MDVYCSVEKLMQSQAAAVFLKCSVLSKFKKCNSYGYKNKKGLGDTVLKSNEVVQVSVLLCH